MEKKFYFKENNMVGGKLLNPWFVVSIVITIFLISLLAWHLIYSNQMVESFESQELAIQRISGDLKLYTSNLEMSANMAAATGDLKWEINYNDYRERLDEVFEKIPELVATEEALEEIEKIKENRQKIDEIESEALRLVARGEKGEAADLLAGWVYTGNQLELIVSTENLASIMGDHINERIAYEQNLTSNLLWVLSLLLLVLIISWYVTIQLWRTNVKKKEEKDQEVHYLSYHDSLTTLANRTFLEEEMERVDREECLPVSIIMLDLNGLKLVNDTFGHAAGDKVLKKAAELLKKTCREEDILARWGGDEFVVLLPGASQQAVRAISNRILNQCRKTYQDRLPISVALGSATKISSNEDDLLAFLKPAEDEMYDHKLSEGRSARNATLSALLKTLSEKSFENNDHFRRLDYICMHIAEKKDLPDSERERLHLLTNMHDIGMIDLPNGLFIKPDELSEKERIMVHKHPETGYRIARSTREFAHIAEGILNHHECWDGSGYPEGLAGRDIPLISRILTIADALEVMSSGRPYKKGMSIKEIVAEFKRCSGKQFDPELVEIVLLLLEENNLEDIMAYPNEIS